MVRVHTHWMEMQQHNGHIWGSVRLDDESAAWNLQRVLVILVKIRSPRCDLAVLCLVTCLSW